MKVHLASINLRIYALKLLKYQRDFESFVYQDLKGEKHLVISVFSISLLIKIKQFSPSASRCDKGYLCHKRAEQTNKRAECGESK